MKVTKISYGRVFSLGNYENEKIAIEADVQEGEDLLKAYVELKQTVEHAHDMRNDLRKYEQAKNIVNYPDEYTGRQVQTAQNTVREFNQKYPSLSEFALLPASEIIESEE